MGKVKDDYEKGYADGRSGKDRTPSVFEEILDSVLPGPSIFDKSTAYKEGVKDGNADSKK